MKINKILRPPVGSFHHLHSPVASVSWSALRFAGADWTNYGAAAAASAAASAGAAAAATAAVYEAFAAELLHCDVLLHIGSSAKCFVDGMLFYYIYNWHIVFNLTLTICVISNIC